MNTSIYTELQDLSAAHKRRRRDSEKRREQERSDEFVLSVEKIKETLIDDLKEAASNGRIQLALIEKGLTQYIDTARVQWTDYNKHPSVRGGWRTVHRHCDKAVVRHPALLELWEEIEAMNLKPIFIEGAYGFPVFGVELPSEEE